MNIRRCNGIGDPDNFGRFVKFSDHIEAVAGHLDTIGKLSVAVTKHSDRADTIGRLSELIVAQNARILELEAKQADHVVTSGFVFLRALNGDWESEKRPVTLKIGVHGISLTDPESFEIDNSFPKGAWAVDAIHRTAYGRDIGSLRVETSVRRGDTVTLTA